MRAAQLVPREVALAAEVEAGERVRRRTGGVLVERHLHNEQDSKSEPLVASTDDGGNGPPFPRELRKGDHASALCIGEVVPPSIEADCDGFV